MKYEDVRLAAVAVNRSQSLETLKQLMTPNLLPETGICFGIVPRDKQQAQKREKRIESFSNTSKFSSYCTRQHVSLI